MSADEREHVSAHEDGERCPHCAPKVERPRERPAPYVVPPSVRTVRAMRNRRRVIE